MLEIGSNPQTGTTYTVVAADRGEIVPFANASPVAVTLPEATGAFGAGFWFIAQNNGAGTVTITPTTSTINGASSLVLRNGQGAWIISTAAGYIAMGWRVPVATEALQGAVELATPAEAEAGLDTERAVTPAGLLAAISGRRSIWIPAVAMYSRTTNGAASGTVETSTHRNMIRSWDFDPTTQEFVQFALCMPKMWDEGPVKAQFVWSHASTTTNFGVVWALEAVAIGDGDDRDVAFGTAQQVADTGAVTNRGYRTAETPDITIAGTPQANDWVLFQAKRVPADGSDTMAIDARLEGIFLHVNVNAFTDD